MTTFNLFGIEVGKGVSWSVGFWVGTIKIWEGYALPRSLFSFYYDPQIGIHLDFLFIHLLEESRW